MNLSEIALLRDRIIISMVAILGLLLGIFSLLRDRDRQTLAKNRSQLEQSKARYKAILEEQAELICRHRRDATVSYVNDAFCDYFGIEKEQIVGYKYTPVIYEADRAKVAQLIRTMNLANPAITVENRVVAKGKVRWTQWNNRMIFDPQDNFIEYQSVGRDITALKEIELKLKESEEKFRRAFEDAATGEALVAPNGSFIKVNQSLCEIVGYSEAELLNKTFQEITHPEDLDLDLEYIRQMLAGEIRTYQMEKRYIHRAGYPTWVLLSVSMVKNIDDEPLYFIAQIQDINQRKLDETRLQDLIIELERSNQELEEFASFVSHDLISPLRRQLILIDKIQEEYGQVLDSEGINYFSKMIDYNSSMEKLIYSLLTYARITTKAQQFVPVDLNEAIENVLKNLEPEIIQAKAQIAVVDKLSIIQGDRLQIRQVLLNLIQNALKFRSRDRVPKIEVEYLQENNWHQISISDNGIGFEPEQQLKIFAPFHRLHSSSKYSGTGLGLAICAKIVERHQGKITAHSQPDRGATFVIYLPINLEYQK